MEEFNVEELVKEISAPEAAREAPVEGSIDDAQAETVQPKETESKGERAITWKGTELSLDDDKYKAYAQKGYDYDQKMHDFRVERKLFDQEQAKIKEQYAELKEINDFATANPQFQKIIQDQWALAQSGQQPAMEPQTQVQILEQKLATVMETLNSQKEATEARRVAEMEASQEGTISKYREANPDMDWESKDDEGNTLEDRIGHAMLEKGVKDFRIMADSFLFQEHMKRKILEGKESAAKGIQKAAKLGLGKVTKESQLAVKPADDISKKSYDQLMMEGLKEIGY